MTRRKRWLTIAALASGLLLAGGWAYLREPSVASLDAGEVRQIEVRFEPWGEDRALRPGPTSDDPEAIAALVRVLRSGEETRDHKCGSRGFLTLRRRLGRPVELRFLPGQDPDWYEFRYAGKVYRVPRVEFVEAMRLLGAEVPLECQ